MHTKSSSPESVGKRKKRRIRESELMEWKRVTLYPLYDIFGWTLLVQVILLFVFSPSEHMSRMEYFMAYVGIPMAGLLAVILCLKFFLNRLAGRYANTEVAVITIIFLNLYSGICLCSFGNLSYMMVVVFFPIIIAPVYKKKRLVYIQVVISFLILIYGELIHVPYFNKDNQVHGSVVEVGEWRIGEAFTVWDYESQLVVSGVVLLLLFYAMVRFELEVMKTTNMLSEQGSRDSLTQLLNHEAFYEVLDEQMQQFEGTKEKFSIIVADIDNFKKVNDTYGHAFGDEVIRQVSEVLRKVCDRRDVCARYGGEEFSVILPGRNLRDAAEHAERIRQRFENTDFTTEGGETLHFTLSLGVAEHNQKYQTASAFFERADKALYEAKRTGKNRVCCWRQGGLPEQEG